MLTWLSRRFSKKKTRSAPTASSAADDPNTRFSVRYDPEKVSLYLDGELLQSVAWQAIDLIAIRIEDEFLPFPYWYVGNKEDLLRIPNNAAGSKELFFEGFKEHVPGYDNDATYRKIIEASGALEGSFILWRGPNAEA